MTKNDDSLRLTKVQYEILEALRDGGTMTVDRSNSSSLGTRAVSLQTRSFLTENRLVERRDKTKSVETSGNGFIISAKGLAALESAQKPKTRSTAATGDKNPEPATDRQREYGGRLGLSFPAEITKSAMSELISKTVDKDADPDPRLMDFARAHGLDISPFVGEGALYDRIFRTLPEEDKARFFVFSVYRWMSDDRESNLDCSPHREQIDEVARQLRDSPQALKSLLRYEGKDLRFFGEATFDGFVHQGGSANTIAFKDARRLLKEYSPALASSGKRKIAPTTAPEKSSPAAQEHASSSWLRFLIGGLMLIALSGGCWLLKAS